MGTRGSEHPLLLGLRCEPVLVSVGSRGAPDTTELISRDVTIASHVSRNNRC
jgi:hypothetical protein